MTSVVGVDPRTGATTDAVAEETSAHELDAMLAAAVAALPAIEALGRSWRACLLRAMADALESRRAAIVATADRETAIGPVRLGGELTRTVYQLRRFAEVVDEGGFLEVTIDSAGPTPMGPGPDLRRMLVPVGPIAVFGASNFPLAFSVPGGDTASAIAAGCPVVVKAHESHPATSLLTFDAMRSAAASVGAPEGLLGIVFGRAAGAALVAHPAIKAVAFTGSLAGGTALLRIIGERPEPIPFFGELSSLNPVVTTPGAVRARGAEIAAGLVDSFTVSGGQLCTKPGLVFVPAGAAGDAVVEAMREAVQGSAPRTLLNRGIAESFASGITEFAEAPGVTLLARGSEVDGDGFRVRPTLFGTDARALSPRTLDECFGPVTVIARYSSDADLDGAIARLPGSLTASVHAEDDEHERLAALFDRLRPIAGRLLTNGYPTGVLVAWAQTHGGPWPSTNTQHTSVGMTATRRFQRPVTWQNTPQRVLPPDLRDDARIPRRVDGTLTLP